MTFPTDPNAPEREVLAIAPDPFAPDVERLRGLATSWRKAADDLDSEVRDETAVDWQAEENETVAAWLRDCASELEAVLDR